MDNRYNRHNRRKYSLKVHIVLATKYRNQLLKGSIADDVKQVIYDVCNHNGHEIIAMETDNEKHRIKIIQCFYVLKAVYVILHCMIFLSI